MNSLKLASDLITDNMILREKIFDTHAHYNDAKFTSLDGGADALLTSDEMKNTVCGIINVGTYSKTSLDIIAQAKKYDFMYAAVGVHPTEAQKYELYDVDAELGKIESLLDTPEKRAENKIVAIGEIGYDFYWQPYDKDLQTEYFERQLNLAEKYALPVSIHNRDAHGDTFEMLIKHKNVRGVIHSCSMSADMACELTRRGWYISFSGTVSFKNAPRVKEACAAIPLDKLLVETDAPYLAPHPHRGKMSDSILMSHTVEAMAEIRGLSFDEMAKITTENAKNIFRLA